MANRVNVNITARDLTRPELMRLRRSFRNLGQDLDRVVTARTRQNWDRLRESLGQSRRQLQQLRGNIPDDEFFRLDASMRRAQRTMQRGFGNVGNRAFGNLVTRLRDIDDQFQQLNRNGQIRVRVDDSALRRADQRLQAGLRARTRQMRVRVRVDPDTDGFNRRVRATLTQPFRQTGRVLGGILSDGIGQGIVSGFQNAGPVAQAAFAAVLASILSLLGAALSGLLVTALGAAFVAIGAASAWQSKQVADQWDSTLASLKENFAGVGEPLIPVLDRALERLEEMGDRAAPKLEQALAETAGSTDKFFQSLMDGFESFGENAFDRIMEAWGVFAPVFGEQWNEFMGELGDAFGDMADLVKEHPTEIAAALEVVFEVIELIVRTITFFGEVWVMNMQMAASSVKVVVDAMSVMVGMVLEGLYSILEGAAVAFQWVPGLGPKLEAAKTAFGSFKEDTMAKLAETKAKADEFSRALDNANKERKLKADISNWQTQLSKAREDLKKTTSQKAEARVKANIRDLENKIAAARRQLNALNGKTAHTWVVTHMVARKEGSHGSQLGGKATGGVIGSAATGGIRGNLTWVGEAGPELVQLPTGSRVRSNPDSRRMMRSAQPSAAAQFVFKSSGRRVDDLLLEILREAIHQRGGDPVKVLGG